jgi:Txe/YoeB family toxin of Txe-Axe toxin-antitoxin module
VEWGIVYYATKDGAVPADAFLESCPSKVEATILAVLEAVRAAPPPAFSGGGKWEAMHAEMRGYYEIRVTGPGRRHYRLFCVLDNGSPTELAARGFDRPQIAVIAGMVKNNRELFSDRDYANVRKLGTHYRSTMPRRIATS